MAPTDRSNARKLLAWYKKEHRDLPWRRTDDPYRIWISEVMLQQTRVETVIPYWERFLARFPDVATLAAAPVDEVLAAWSGLGYYRRARQMHAAARLIAARGSFPRRARELLALPGIGAYTAAAVASIAFGEAVPVLDGNVERVLCRLLALAGDPKRKAIRDRLLEQATLLVDDREPGASNQALMELGATVCLPRRPRCARCPLALACRARAAGDVERYPPPRRRKASSKVEWTVALCEYRGRTLFFRRPKRSAILPGMWELPNVAHQDPASAEVELARIYGGSFQLEREVAGRVRHAITHRALTLHIHRGVFEAGDSVAEGREAAWIPAAERGDYGVSSMFEKALRIE